MIFYVCDCLKNKECPGTYCQVECLLTTHEEFSERDLEGKPRIAYIDNKVTEDGTA